MDLSRGALRALGVPLHLREEQFDYVGRDRFLSELVEVEGCDGFRRSCPAPACSRRDPQFERTRTRANGRKSSLEMGWSGPTSLSRYTHTSSIGLPIL
jgi:hypothetical protein